MTTQDNLSPASRLDDVKRRIVRAAELAKRNASGVRLVAVSKTFDGPAIRQVLEAGHRVFGENRVQEASGKWPELREDFPDVQLHLIGPLQSNKAREAIGLFDVIETVDREKLAKTLAQEFAREDFRGRRPRLFVQVNTGEEPQKAGVPPREAMDFVDRCRTEHRLDISGLMCIPPFDDPPGPHFALLGKLAESCGVRELSMGMSGDYEDAVMLGSTNVRVGSAIFGARATSA